MFFGFLMQGMKGLQNSLMGKTDQTQMSKFAVQFETQWPAGVLGALCPFTAGCIMTLMVTQVLYMIIPDL